MHFGCREHDIQSLECSFESVGIFSLYDKTVLIKHLNDPKQDLEEGQGEGIHTTNIPYV